jgi:hypothetical protein
MTVACWKKTIFLRPQAICFGMTGRSVPAPGVAQLRKKTALKYYSDVIKLWLFNRAAATFEAPGCTRMLGNPLAAKALLGVAAPA